MSGVYIIRKIFKFHEFVEIETSDLYMCFNRESEYFFLNKSDLLTGILVESESLPDTHQIKNGVGFKFKTVNDLNSLLYIL